mmetsp:Transcript_29478/g.80918  ORF Transcript_29478/g.80918 Transcript_29478/m.80918 type:complete len:347 (-) Transcript_29478:148-1188(-)
MERVVEVPGLQGHRHHHEDDHDQVHGCVVLLGRCEVKVQRCVLIALAACALDEATGHRLLDDVLLSVRHPSLDEVLTRDHGPRAVDGRPLGVAVEAVGEIRNIGVEGQHLTHGLLEEALHALVGASVVGLQPAAPGTHRQVRFGILPDAEQGHAEHQDDGEQRHLRGQDHHQLVVQDLRVAAWALRHRRPVVRVEDRHAPHELGQAADPRAHPGGPRAAHQHDVHARVSDVHPARVPQQVGDLEDHGDGPDDVHEEEGREGVCGGLHEASQHNLHDEEDRYQGHEPVHDDICWIVRKVEHNAQASTEKSEGQRHYCHGPEQGALQEAPGGLSDAPEPHPPWRQRAR